MSDVQLPQPLMLTSPTTAAAAVSCSETGQLFVVLDNGVVVAPVAPLAAAAAKRATLQPLESEARLIKLQPFEPVATYVPGPKDSVSLASRFLLLASPKHFRSVAVSPPGCTAGGGGCLVCVCGGPRYRAVVYAPPLHTSADATWRPVADVTELAFVQHWAPSWHLASREIHPIPRATADAVGVLFDPDDALIAELAQGTPCVQKRTVVHAKPPSDAQLRGDLYDSALAQRIACAIPHCSAWSPVVGRGTWLLLATGAPAAVVVVRMRPGGTNTDIAVAEVFPQPVELGPVSSLAFAPETMTTTTTGLDSCYVLAIASGTGSVVLRRFGVAGDGSLRHDSSTEIAQPCNRHVSVMLWVNDPCESGPSGLAFAHGCRLCFWDSRSGTVVSKDAHLGAVTGIAYSRLMQSFFTSSTDGTVKSWKLEGSTLSEGITIPMPGDAPPMGVACSPSGALLWFPMCAPLSLSLFVIALISQSSGVEKNTPHSSPKGEGTVVKARTLLYTILLLQDNASTQAICDSICEPVLSKRMTAQSWLHGATDLLKVLATKPDAPETVLRIASTLLENCELDTSHRSEEEVEENLARLHLVFFLCCPFFVS